MSRSLFLFAIILLAACGPSPAPKAAVSSGSEKAAPARPRFDVLVREDFFAGIGGDLAALDRAIALCEKTLARDPRHAEALVWHGAALVAKSSLAFRKGDTQTGRALWVRGTAEMDRAVSLEPDNVGTLIPRGATLLAMSYHVPEAMQQQLLRKGVTDYQAVLRIQAPYFEQLSRHARGQLLYGLADGLSRMGKNDQAREHYQRLARDLPDTAYGKRAAAWLAGGASADPLPCGGCHATRER